MRIRTPLLLLMGCLLILEGMVGGQSALAEPGPIEWKTPGPASAKAQPADPRVVLGAGTERHVVVQFEEPLPEAMHATLSARGVTLLTYLGSNAYFAKVRGGPAAMDTLEEARLWAAFDIPANRKLHPKIEKGELPEYAVFMASGSASGLTTDSKGEEVQTAALYVIFHPDVDLLGDGIAAVKRHGGMVRDYMVSINAVVVWMPLANVPALASEDEVQWVEPPLPPLDGVNNSNRAITQVDLVNSAPYDLNGAGVGVLVYDAGTARSTHADFGGRLFVRDGSGMLDHSTHVSGTIGGSGSASGGTYRGMAPGVVIQSYGFQYDGSGYFLYTNPGDLEADYNEAINTYGAEVSSNSIGTNVAANGWPCDYEGNYGATDMLIDAIVRGSLGAPMRVIWANGNERGSGRCGTTYHTTAPPGCAKNHIAVGALNSNDDSMTSFSSWGPSDDGRIKPDVSAPGCQSNDDYGVTSCDSTSDTAYTVMCGTSMACPTVTGIAALILQDWKTQFPGESLPRNSTLKILLAHNAADLGNAGPDYQFGYGSVRVRDTIDFLRGGSFLEESISQGQDKFYSVYVAGGTASLRATLAWDDPPGAANVIPELVNDLDLAVISASSAIYYPWTLDPGNPSNPAVRTQADHRNNIEQVVVDSPAPGTWTIRVRGYAVAQGPQIFSLATTPHLYSCSSVGQIHLDHEAYSCGGAATIQVIDCDLDTDPNAVETVTVSMVSTSEPSGETVMLTETGPHTATFTGAIALSTTDAPGVLFVAHGDTITAIYHDANDGSGNPATVTASALIDCQAPTISNVQVSGVRARSATVTFSADELTTGSVRCGLACGGPYTITAQDLNWSTSHTCMLTGFSPETTYYFEVDAVDAAGNADTDNNGGACYGFTTLAAPDYFTEQFSNNNDLDNETLRFIPDGSISYYHACVLPAATFPTDPSGGTGLTLSDDSYATVTLRSGAHVSLYGVSYSKFYVGSNGYITFTSGDSTWGESLTAHFNQPRISALFDDLNPGASGAVSWKQLADRVAVTYLSIPEYGAANQNSFQVELFFNGEVGITWLAIAAADGLAGLSGVSSVPTDFTSSDLTAYSSCQPPEVTALAINNGAELANTRTVTLNNTCTDAPTHYMAGESPDFSGAAWQPYNAAPSFLLSAGNGTKTVYFKVKSIVGESAPASDTIVLAEPPVVAVFAINNGAESTTNRAVTLDNTCTNGPTDYMASESPDFSGAAWQAYSSAPSFTLSAGNGVKTVYFKVKNAGGESAPVSDAIVLAEPPVIAMFAINNGAESTTNRAVTLDNTCTNGPTDYMASGSPDFSGAAWQAYSSAPSFTLSAGNGLKTVYFKVKNAGGESAPASDSITLAESNTPVVTSFAINHDAESTTSRTVRLYNTCTNSPTNYMASESPSFAGATWKTYSTGPSFVLSTINGVKTVYFKVRNAAGESPVVSDSILLSLPLPAVTSFAINGGAETTTSRTVMLNNACTQSPTYYMASESPSFTGASWRSYSASPAFTLSTGDGTKTVYFKVKNTGGESPAVSDTIALVEPPPTVTSFAINSGAETTTSRSVRLNNTCTSMPTQYLASESLSFTGASWKTYTTGPSFTLSTMNGIKTVYFKVRNAAGESPVVSDSIVLSLPLPAVTSFTINGSVETTTSRTVTLNNVCTEDPTYYMASESPGFTGASWRSYSAGPAFTLSTGNGTKTVYFKVKNSGGESPAVSDTIALAEPPPTISSFAINSGAETTPSRSVTLNNVCTNSPTQYMASESASFTGATWKTYKTAASFTLSAGNGTKTVYFKVKNGGGESGVASDTIVLNVGG